MSQRLPVYFIPHGGGPWPFVELGGVSPDEKAALIRYLAAIPGQLSEKPRSILVISAHWEMPQPTLMTGENPPLYYDYYNFPPESYQIQWPAPGAPDLAARVAERLAGAGMRSAVDSERGFDHGTFIPLKVSFPEADIPTTQLSLIKGLDPAAHIRLGEVMQPLRGEGVLILCSGMSYHDLRGFFSDSGAEVSRPFDDWLHQAVSGTPEERRTALMQWDGAPNARRAHPREEHLLPLMVASGAAGTDAGKLDFSGTFGKARISAFRFG